MTRTTYKSDNPQTRLKSCPQNWPESMASI